MKSKFIFLVVIIFLVTQLVNPVFAQDTKLNITNEDTNTDKSLFSLLNNNILSFGFGVFGVIGTIYTIYSYRITKKEREENKKERELNRVIFEAAGKSLDKEAIETEIKKMEEKKGTYAVENQKYEESLKQFRDQIEKGIPNEARKAVLKGKIRSQEEILVQTYNSLQASRKELNDVTNSSQLSPEVQKMIEDEIRPEYIVKEEQSKIKDYLLFITTGAIIISSIVPYPLNNIVTILVLIIAINPLIKIAKSRLSYESVTNKSILLKYTHIGLVTFSFLFFVTSVYFMGFHSSYGFFMILPLLLIEVLFAYAYIKIRKEVL